MTVPLRKLGLSLLSFLAMLLLVEIGVRLVVGDVRSFSRPDDLLGWSYIPGAYYRFSAPEGCPGWVNEGHINSHGLRDVEFPAQKPPGMVRILALGDSQTEGLQVPLEDTWPKVLEARLNARGDDRRYQVINAGRSGMGTALELLYFRERGVHLAPDVVVTAFHLNDFQDNSRELAGATNLGPYLIPQGDGWTVDDSFLERRDYRLRKALMPWKRSSVLVSMSLKAYSTLRGRQANAETLDGPDGEPPAEGFWVEDAAPAWQRSIDLTGQLLVALHEEVSGRGMGFLLVASTLPRQVHPEARASSLEVAPHWDLDLPQRRIGDVAARHGVPFLDLRPRFLAAATAEGVRLHGCEESGWSGHWNVEGHRRAADAIAEALVQHGLLPDLSIPAGR